jgi:hypothetical protein
VGGDTGHREYMVKNNVPFDILVINIFAINNTSFIIALHALCREPAQRANFTCPT